MADVSDLASFPPVKMCQIDGLEGIEIFAMIRVQLREIAQKNERGGAKNSRPPPVGRGLNREVCPNYNRNILHDKTLTNIRLWIHLHEILNDVTQK